MIEMVEIVELFYCWEESNKKIEKLYFGLRDC